MTNHIFVSSPKDIPILSPSRTLLASLVVLQQHLVHTSKYFIFLATWVSWDAICFPWAKPKKLTRIQSRVLPTPVTPMKPQELCQQCCQILNLELKKDKGTPQDAWAFAHELHFSVTQMPKYTEYFKTSIIWNIELFVAHILQGFERINWWLTIDTPSLLQWVLSTPFECTYLRCCVWVIRGNQSEGHIRHSWLPYSTYLYLDFYLFCSMTKLKEYSREICYPRRVPIFVLLFDKYKYIVRCLPKLDHQPFPFCQGIIWCVCFVHEIYLQCKRAQRV